ncbi:hypothetical protein V6R21_10415 [Limibacter armeniacum]|uniref:hypothetical protein n=1 Tax=Limibacter armeniacum TaxID=466084 RepID=UPI002FE5CB13
MIQSEKDYIKRIVDQLALFLAKALKLSQEGKHMEALETISINIEKVSDLKKAEIDAFSARELLEVMISKGFFLEQVNAVAELLLYEVQIKEEMTGKSDRVKLEKILKLIEYIDQQEKSTYSFDRQFKIEEIRRKLR